MPLPHVSKSHMWGHYRACELYVRGSPPPLRKCYMWGHYRAHEPHVSCTWGAPLHHWGNATREGITVHVSHMWAVHEGLPSTIEGMLHVRALPCTWATHELYVRGSPPPLRKCYMWGHYRAREPHMSCTWGAPLHHWGNATREGITVHVSHTWAVHEGLPSTIEGMLHVRALLCTWATRELYMRGSPPPLRKCYTWGHYRAREPHMSCTWGAPLHHWGNATCEGITVHVSHTWAVHEGLPSTIEEMLHVRALPCTWATRELYVRGSPPPLRKCYTWGHYHAREPHVSCTWGAPLHHWGNATCEGITVHVSHTWLMCMCTAPLHLPKKVTKKQPVNHIGSSDEPPISV